MEHIEYEERVLISYNDYQLIVQDLKNQNFDLTSFDIENIYLDTKKLKLTKNGMMLRIRNISNAPQELTLKIKDPSGGHLEINETLADHPRIDECLKKKFSKYQEITRLLTKRIEIPFDDYLLVLDENRYSNKVDYDIEIESSSQEKAKEIILKYCEKYHLTYKEKYRSKSKRAIKEFKKAKD